jgi:hypothetical protein
MNSSWQMPPAAITLEKAFETKISQKNPDYQGLAEFKALTLRVNCDEKKFDTQLI